jgi:hypothetical protein
MSAQSCIVSAGHTVVTKHRNSFSCLPWAMEEQDSIGESCGIWMGNVWCVRAGSGVHAIQFVHGGCEAATPA